MIQARPMRASFIAATMRMGLLNTLDLFSGVGGITHALRDVAHPVMYCEIDPAPRAILGQLVATGRLPDAPLHNDVSTLTASTLTASTLTASTLTGDGSQTKGVQKVDMIVAGFPCTAVSTAGRQEGLAHPATGLFWQVVRLAKELDPDYLFLENVAAISEKRQGAHDEKRSVLEDVVLALDEVGYATRWTTVPAYQLGAPMQRYRWYCLCYKKGLLPEVGDDNATGTTNATGPVLDFGRWAPFDWSSEPAGPRMVRESPAAKVRAAALGNSVVPDCATLAFRALWTGFSVPLGDLGGLSGPVRLRHMQFPGKAEARSSRHGVGGPGGIVVPLPPPPGVVPKPAPSIVLDPAAYAPPAGYKVSPTIGQVATAPFPVSTWPSPRYRNGWRGAQVLTWRGRGDLGTAVRFAGDDPSRYPAGRTGYTNPEFVEWLMGYPPGWTEVPVVLDQGPTAPTPTRPPPPPTS